MKVTIWNDLHPNDPPRPGLIILDAPSKAGDGNRYISCACGGGDVEELNETARRIVALWNAAEELGLTTEKVTESEIQRTFRLVESHSGVIEVALQHIEKLEAEKAEMLAILEELRESSTCCGTYDLLDETTWASPDLADRIEAAIRKARGEE